MQNKFEVGSVVLFSYAILYIRHEMLIDMSSSAFTLFILLMTSEDKRVHKDKMKDDEAYRRTLIYFHVDIGDTFLYKILRVLIT